MNAAPLARAARVAAIVAGASAAIAGIWGTIAVVAAMNAAGWGRLPKATAVIAVVLGRGFFIIAYGVNSFGTTVWTADDHSRS
jgi:hypothetical protein